MSEFAIVADKLGYTVRSGGADGADSAFEVATKKELFLPWEGFKNKTGFVLSGESREHAMTIAKKFHPNWAACSWHARELHARNSCQVLGFTLNCPAKFIVCWTTGGNLKGGTSQALRIAIDLIIPIYNLAIVDDYNNIVDIIDKHKSP